MGPPIVAHMRHPQAPARALASDGRGQARPTRAAGCARAPLYAYSDPHSRFLVSYEWGRGSWWLVGAGCWLEGGK
jgi:hypothetical protein